MLGARGLFALTVLTVALPATARAGYTFALEGGLAIPTGDTASRGSSGATGALRAGYVVRLPLIRLTPELVLGYGHLPLEVDVKTYRGAIGGRVSIGSTLSPAAFAHLGYGRCSSSSDVEHCAGVTYDVGAGLDFTLLPLVDLGVFGAYDAIAAGNGSSFTWVTLGVQVALVL